MNRIARLVAVLALVLVFAPVLAQETVNRSYYVVVDGDTIYDLVGGRFSYTPQVLAEVTQDNPFLREPGRLYRVNDVQHARIIPGERLYGMAKYGVQNTYTPPAGPKPPSNDDKPNDEPKTVIEKGPIMPTWVFWFLVVMALVIAFLFSRWLRALDAVDKARGAQGAVEERLRVEQERRERLRATLEEADRRLIEAERNRNPITSGPAMVEGGVTDATATLHLQDVAARGWFEMTGREALRNHFTILSIQRGRGFGILGVRYRDASVAERRLNGETVYRATVRMPDSEETKEILMLQGCGNDLLYGNIEAYEAGDRFRFEADADVPVTQATTEPVAPAAETAASPAAQTVVPASEPTTEDSSGVRLTYIPANENGPHRIVMAGIDLSHAASVDMSEDSLVFRFTPRS